MPPTTTWIVPPSAWLLLFFLWLSISAEPAPNVRYDIPGWSPFTSAEPKQLEAVSARAFENPYTLAFKKDGTLFLSSFTLNHILKISFHYGSSHRATYKVYIPDTHMLDGPAGMAFGVDSSNRDILFISSFTTDRILRYNTSDDDMGKLVSVFGNEEELDCPQGMSFGSDGFLYVVSFLGRKVVRYNATTGAYMGCVYSDQNNLVGPEDVKVMHNGILLVSVYFRNHIAVVNLTTSALVKTISHAHLSGPTGLYIASDHTLYVSSYRTNQILHFDSTLTHLLGISTQSASHTLSGPCGLVMGPDASLYIASYANHKVVRYNESLDKLTTAASEHLQNYY